MQQESREIVSATGTSGAGSSPRLKTFTLKDTEYDEYLNCSDSH